MPDAQAITIESALGDSRRDDMARDVRAGLSRPLKELPPKYFYDARGSELFERITELECYYPTRCERQALERHASEIVGRCSASELVELGSGSPAKARLLLDPMCATGEEVRYLPVDISESALEQAALELVGHYPELTVHGLVGDFRADMGRLPNGRRRLVAFLGGTIGNLYPRDRVAFLSGVRGHMNPGDRLLLGADLVKPVDVLEAAYNDPQGVTADFNRNVLRVLNRELDAEFDPDSFEHVAFFDSENEWIEMRLRSRASQRVPIPGADIEVELDAAEDIRTEISAKFTRERLERELGEAGLAVERVFTDDGGRFALVLATLSEGAGR